MLTFRAEKHPVTDEPVPEKDRDIESFHVYTKSDKADYRALGLRATLHIGAAAMVAPNISAAEDEPDLRAAVISGIKVSTA